MPSLQLPPTIRLASINDVPDTPENRLRIRSANTALLQPGFTIKPNIGQSLPFRFFAEINVDNAELWKLFVTLARNLPSPSCLIYHYFDEAPTYSPYMDANDLTERFRQRMADFSLTELQELAFIDQFPRVTEALSRHEPNCLDTWEVLGQLLRRVGSCETN